MLKRSVCEPELDVRRVETRMEVIAPYRRIRVMGADSRDSTTFHPEKKWAADGNTTLYDPSIVRLAG